MTAEERLKHLGLTLPAVPDPLGAYIPAVHTGNLVFVSGQLPRQGSALLFTGKVGQEVTVEQAREAARLAALHVLAVVRRGLGSLNRVHRVVRVDGYVASAPNFTEQPSVVNGASELLGQVFGEPGRHSRIAVGVAALPLGAPVEIAAVFEVLPA
jgi:enamine deaminase RidA (YjgF/YER057c/UK114 family)